MGALRQIFENFGINDKRNQKKIDRLFQDTRRINEVLKANPKEIAAKIEPRDFTVIALARIVQAMIARWQKVSPRKDEIYAQRKLFIDLLQMLLKQKKVSISQRNKLEIATTEGLSLELSLTDLSSGEKQIVVMLSEALLRRRGSHIYIADEPELSLHIEWQERLVDVITELNPNAQIIFATHSPDIIGKRTQIAFDMSRIGSHVAE